MLKTLISNVKGFALAKKRLIIEYVLIGAIATLAGALLTMWLINRNNTNKIDLLSSQVTTLSVQVGAQTRTIENLRELRQLDSHVLENLATDYKTLVQKDQNFYNHLTTLERNNAQSNDYLNQPIPADVVCLLNGNCEGSASASDDNAQPSGGIDAGMLPPPTN